MASPFDAAFMQAAKRSFDLQNKHFQDLQKQPFPNPFGSPAHHRSSPAVGHHMTAGLGKPRHKIVIPRHKPPHHPGNFTPPMHHDPPGIVGTIKDQFGDGGRGVRNGKLLDETAIEMIWRIISSGLVAVGNGFNIIITGLGEISVTLTQPMVDALQRARLSFQHAKAEAANNWVNIAGWTVTILAGIAFAILVIVTP